MIVDNYSAVAYPATLPNPTRQLSGTIDYGVLRSGEQGFPDQARTNGANSTMMSLQFQLTLAEYKEFSDFMNSNVGSWIAMPTVNQYPFIFGDITPVVHDTVRLSSSISAQPLGARHMIVSARFEAFPRDIHNSYSGSGGDVEPPPDGTVFDWIIARDPGNPATDWWIAGDPGSPSDSNHNIAGAPADHI